MKILNLSFVKFHIILYQHYFLFYYKYLVLKKSIKLENIYLKINAAFFNKKINFLNISN